MCFVEIESHGGMFKLIAFLMCRNCADIFVNMNGNLI